MLVSIFCEKHWCVNSWSFWFSHLLQGFLSIPLMCLCPLSQGQWEWWAGATFICLCRDLFKVFFFFYKNSYFILYSNYYMMMIKRFKMIRLSVLGRNFSAVITISLREAPTCCFLSISAWQHQYRSTFVLFGTSNGFQIFLLPRKKFKRGRYSFPGKICWVC